MVHLCWGNLNKTGETGYKEWNVADRKLRQSFPSLLLSSLLQVLTAGKEEKNSFGTCSEKSLSFPEGNLSVWAILAAALHFTITIGKGLQGVLPHSPHLTTPFGLLLQEWGPEHVILLGPDFSWCTCTFSCLLITPPLAVVFSHHSPDIHLSCKGSVRSECPVSPAGGILVRSPAVSFSLVHFPSPVVQGDRSVPDCSEVTHKGGDRYLWKAFSRKLASFSQSS